MGAGRERSGTAPSAAPDSDGSPSDTIGPEATSATFPSEELPIPAAAGAALAEPDAPETAEEAWAEPTNALATSIPTIAMDNTPTQPATLRLADIGDSTWTLVKMEG
jgi:hypothetical protein